MTNKPVSAPDVIYPTIVEAPRSSNVPWLDEPHKAPAGAVDQTYPEIVPAPLSDRQHRCPHCGEAL